MRPRNAVPDPLDYTVRRRRRWFRSVFAVQRGEVIIATTSSEEMASKIAGYLKRHGICTLFRWRCQPAVVRVAFCTATRMLEPNLPYKDPP